MTVTDGTSPADPPERGPRTQPGATMEIYAPEQHDLYDGRFIISGARIYQVGTLNDESPWDHMGNDGSNLRPVEGTVELDVDEINNTGSFRAELELPEGSYVIDLEEFKEFSPCQDGGIAVLVVRARRFRLRGCLLAQEHSLRGWLGYRLRHLEWRAALPGLPDSLHGHPGHARPQPGGPLSARGEEVSGRRRQPRPSSNWTSTSAVPKPTTPTFPTARCSTTSSPWK